MYLVDATPLQSEHRLRGVGTYVRYLLPALLRQAPEEIRFILSSFSPAPVPEELTQRSIKIPRGHRPAQMYWLYNELLLRQALFRDRPIVFHSTDFNGLVTTRHTTTVATLHDIMALKTPPAPSATLSERLSWYRWTTYFGKLQHAPFIIAVSDSVKEDAVQHLGIDADKIITIYPGVDTARFHPEVKLPNDLKLGSYVLCIGACQPNKNYPRILEAFGHVQRELPNLSLVIAGAWHPDQLQWLKKAARKEGIDDKVHHLGFTPSEILPALYANAMAFLFPSLDEGFGSPLVEAMASGTPIITSNRGALKEVAGKAAILVNPHDVLSIAKGIQDVEKSPGRRAWLRDAGLARSRLFSWDNVATRTLEVYRAASRLKV